MTDYSMPLLALTGHELLLTATDCQFVAAGPRQHSDSWFRVPRDSWQYFTLWNSGSVQRALTATQVKVKVTSWPTVSKPVNLGVKPLLRPNMRFLLLAVGRVTADGLPQHSHSWLQSPRDPWPRFSFSPRHARVSKWGLLLDEGRAGVSM
jgi:hypothetical protein